MIGKTPGAQKKLFDSKRDEPEHQPCEYQCPMKCGSRETAQHFLQCEKVNTTAEMKRVLDSLRKCFVWANTNQVLTTTIMHCITSWLQFGEQPNMTSINIDNESSKDQIISAVKAQSVIGWDHFFKGRISKHWGDIQQTHYDKE